MTWSSSGSAVGTWGAASSVTSQMWRRLSVVTDAQLGVDFNLAVDDQYPWAVLDHDPQTVIDAPQTRP